MIISWTPASFAAAMMVSEPPSWIETANILGHAAGEQFDILRQIADIAAEHIGGPLIERRAIDPHLAAERLPYTYQRADQRRLARSAWPYDSQSVSGLERERHILNDDPLIARGHDADTLDRQADRWALQRWRHGSRGQRFEQPVQALPALPRGNEAFPMGDRQIDRRQRPRAQDRTRNDNARGRLLMDHQIGADGKHRRLQGHPHDLGNRAETPGDVAGALIAGKIPLVGLAPALGEAAGHSHRDQYLGVAPAAGGQIIAARRQAHRLPRRLTRHEFRDQGEGDQNDGADQRRQADQDMERETDRQIERQPTENKEHARAHASEERTNIVQVAQRLKALVATADHQRQAHNGFEHPIVEGFVERRSDTTQNPSPDQVEEALGDVQSAGENDQTDQCRYAPAWGTP